MTKTRFFQQIINLTILLSLVFLSPAVVLALDSGTVSTIPTVQIQKQLDQFIQDHAIPGIVFGIERKGERWLGSSGVSNVETGEKMTPDIQIRLASITKTFTATMIMKLVESGKLDLNDTLDKWLPGKIINGATITVTMLLNHTSGLYDHENTPESSDKLVHDPTYTWTEDEVIQLINKYSPDFAPGAKQSYCNSGYYLLGMIAERASNDTVDTLTQNYIFSPAGMTRSHLTREGALTSPCTPGYVIFDVNDKMINEGAMNFTWDWTAGSGVSTVPDMLLFVRSLFSGKLVSQDSLKKMLTPVPPSKTYGFGIGIIPESANYELAYSHGGYNPGTGTGWYYFPKTDCILFYGVNFTEYREKLTNDFGIALSGNVLKIYKLLFPAKAGVSSSQMMQ